MYILYKVISLLLIRKDETLILVIYLTLNSRGWRMKYVRARYIIMNVFVLIHILTVRTKYFQPEKKHHVYDLKIDRYSNVCLPLLLCFPPNVNAKGRMFRRIYIIHFIFSKKVNSSSKLKYKMCTKYKCIRAWRRDIYLHIFCSIFCMHKLSDFHTNT